MITTEDFTRINNDVNGNPRYVASWCAMGAPTYNAAITACRAIGGRRFHNKQFGCGVMFSSYSLKSEVCDEINALSAYDWQAIDFLTKTGTKLSLKFLRHGKYFTDDEDSRDIYRFTLSNSNGRYSAKFGQSIANTGRKPTAYDVLSCLDGSDAGSLEDFCANYGYDTDSREVFQIYKAVKRQAEGMRRLFSADHLEALAEIN